MCSTLSTHTMGFPLEVCICFCKAVSAVFPFQLEYPHLSLKKQHQHLILHQGEKLLGDRRVNGYLCELLFGGQFISVNLHGEKNMVGPHYYESENVNYCFTVTQL